MTTQLRAATDADYAWLLGLGAPTDSALAVVDGGIAPPETLAMLRQHDAGMRHNDRPGTWMILEEGLVAGLLIFKTNRRDSAEIGYGVAPALRGRGVATRAVARLRSTHDQRRLIAETAPDNVASHRVLERNGFAMVGRRDDPEDGPVLMWETAADTRRPRA